MIRPMACLVLLGSAALDQQENRDLKVNLDDLRYPPLAAAARIQGDVAIEVSAAGQQPMSGHPLLARAVLANLGTWTLPPLEGGKYEINYNFKFIDPSIKWETVLIGNKLDRFFWRLAKAPTKKTIRSCYYDPALKPPPRYTVLKVGNDYIINVFVAEHEHCLQPESSTVA